MIPADNMQTMILCAIAAIIQIVIGLALIFNKIMPKIRDNSLNPKNESLIPIIGIALIMISDLVLILILFLQY